MLLPEAAPETVTVTWARVEPHLIDFYCSRAPRAYRAQVYACAVPTGQTCTIYTTKAPSFEVVGHELAHCYGWQH